MVKCKNRKNGVGSYCLVCQNKKGKETYWKERKRKPFGLDDLTGEIFNRLTVIKRVNTIGLRPRWLCKCSCGKDVEASSTALRMKRQQSCGCYGREINHKPKFLLRTYQESSFNYFWKTFVKRAKKKFGFHLERNEWDKIVRQPCHYCARIEKRCRPLVFKEMTEEERAKHDIFINGVDRLDSSKGYELENCVPCCWGCNTGKSNKSYAEFILMCELVVRNRSTKYCLINKVVNNG